MAFVSWGMFVREGSVFDHTIELLQHEIDFNAEFSGIKCEMYVPDGRTLRLLDTATITTENLDSEKYRLYQYAIGYDQNIVPWHPFNNIASPSFQCFIFEAYFNNAFSVSDSIFLSVKNASDLCAWFEYHTPYSLHYTYPPLSYRFADTNATVDAPWEQGVTYCYPLVFPIIRRDCDSCPQVRGVELFKGSSTQFFLRWESGVNHRDWQVSYGPAGTAPDDGTMLDFSQRQSSLITVDPDSHYVAYVRARCRFARDEWGPWSDPIDVHLNAPSNGIDAPGAAAATLTPNPASKYVTVTAQNPIALVEAYDERGALVDRQHGNGTDALRLDTRTWSAGTYILRIHTAKGIVTHNLSIVR